MKKIVGMLLIFITILSINLHVYADDLDEENMNEEELKQNIKEVSGTVEDVPKTTSRAVLIYDRTSRKSFI